MHLLRTWTATLALASCAFAEDISGTAVIHRELTKRRVTMAVPLYQRGATAKLGQTGMDDPLAFERSHVVLYLESSAASLPVPGSPSYAVRQEGRQFVPDLIAVPAGAAVSFPNMDPVFHNIFSLSQPKLFDLGSYDKGQSRSVVFPKPGIVSVFCHLHPNMTATVVVAPSQWVVRADRSGHYRLHDVPPGRYTLVAWHKAAGTFRKEVVVEAGRETLADFVLPLSDTQMLRTAKSEAGPRP